MFSLHPVFSDRNYFINYAISLRLNSTSSVEQSATVRDLLGAQTGVEDEFHRAEEVCS